MYKYIIKAIPSKLDNKFNFMNFKQEIFNACRCVSNDLAFKRDNKMLKVKSIKDLECIFILTCKFELRHPTRSMSAITRYIRRNNDVENYVYNKTLFSFSIIDIIHEKEEKENIHIERVTNEELFKDIYSLLFNPTVDESDVSIRSKKIREIKKIIYID